MEHVGIDLGSKESQVCVVSSSGQKVREVRVPTRQLERLLSKLEPSRIAMETCSESTAIAQIARRHHHEVRVVPSSLVRALGVGARGIKTDQRDAETLAMASHRLPDLPSVHIKQDHARERLRVLAMRRRLVEARKNLVNGIKSYLRTELLSISTRFTSAFTTHVRDVLTESPVGLAEDVALTLTMIEQLTEKIDVLDERLKQQAQNDEVTSLLMTIPGIGPITALTLQSTLDDPSRFESKANVASYLGLVPGEDTTGFRTKRTGTIHAAPLALKALLVQSAWSLWRTRKNEPLARWAQAIAERRGKRIAIVALARKLATIAWSMWKHGTKYDPTRAARPSESSMREDTMP
jgi:transposase